MSWPSAITRPLRRRDDAADDVDQRGLAGAVRPEQREDLALAISRLMGAARAPRTRRTWSGCWIEMMGGALIRHADRAAQALRDARDQRLR
jgi:hypothetical protein